MASRKPSLTAWPGAGCGARYPVVDGVPVLINEARSVFSLEDFAGRRNTTFELKRSRLDALLHGILDRLRRGKRWREEELREQTQPHERPDLRLDIARAVEQLPERARLVFLLHDVEGFRHDELSDVLGVSVGTVKSHVNALLRKLGLRDRVQATILAYDLGLARPNPPGTHL